MTTTRTIGLVGGIGDGPSEQPRVARGAGRATTGGSRQRYRSTRWPSGASCNITLYLASGETSCTVHPQDCTTPADAATYVHAFAGALGGSARAVLLDADGQPLGEVAFERSPGAAPPALLDQPAQNDQHGKPRTGNDLTGFGAAASPPQAAAS